MKKIFLLSNRNFPWHNLRPFLLSYHLSLVKGNQTPAHCDLLFFIAVVALPSPGCLRDWAYLMNQHWNLGYPNSSFSNTWAVDTECPKAAKAWLSGLRYVQRLHAFIVKQPKLTVKSILKYWCHCKTNIPTCSWHSWGQHELLTSLLW